MSEEGLVALNEPNPELRGAEIEVPLLDVLPKPSLGCPETTRPYFDSIPPAFFPLGSYVLRSQPLKQEKLLFVIQCTVQFPHPRRPGGSLAPSRGSAPRCTGLWRPGGLRLQLSAFKMGQRGDSSHCLSPFSACLTRCPQVEPMALKPHQSMNRTRMPLRHASSDPGFQCTLPSPTFLLFFGWFITKVVLPKLSHADQNLLPRTNVKHYGWLREQPKEEGVLGRGGRWGVVRISTASARSLASQQWGEQPPRGAALAGSRRRRRHIHMLSWKDGDASPVFSVAANPKQPLSSQTPDLASAHF